MMGQDFPRVVEGYDVSFIKLASATVQNPNYVEVSERNGPGVVERLRLLVVTDKYQEAAKGIIQIIIDGSTAYYGRTWNFIGGQDVIPFTGVTSAHTEGSSTYILQAIVKLVYRTSIAVRYYPTEPLGNVTCYVWIEGARGS